MAERPEVLSKEDLSNVLQPLVRASRDRDRLTTCFTVTYEHEVDQPIQIPLVFDEHVDNPKKEQAYQRQITVTNTWQPLDLGWLAGFSGVIIIENQEGRQLKVNPTEEEAKEIAGRVIIIAYDKFGQPNYERVPPRDAYRGRPTLPEGLQVKSENGQEIRAKVTVFPR